MNKDTGVGDRVRRIDVVVIRNWYGWLGKKGFLETYNLGFIV